MTKITNQIEILPANLENQIEILPGQAQEPNKGLLGQSQELKTPKKRTAPFIKNT